MNLRPKGFFWESLQALPVVSWMPAGVFLPSKTPPKNFKKLSKLQNELTKPRKLAKPIYWPLDRAYRTPTPQPIPISTPAHCSLLSLLLSFVDFGILGWWEIGTLSTSKSGNRKRYSPKKNQTTLIEANTRHLI